VLAHNENLFADGILFSNIILGLAFLVAVFQAIYILAVLGRAVLIILSWSSRADLDQEDVASQSAEGRKETSESQCNEISDETAQTHGIDQEIIIENLKEGDKLLDQFRVLMRKSATHYLMRLDELEWKLICVLRNLGQDCTSCLDSALRLFQTYRNNLLKAMKEAGNCSPELALRKYEQIQKDACLFVTTVETTISTRGVSPTRGIQHLHSFYLRGGYNEIHTSLDDAQQLLFE
jgi:hypothetical protein